MRALPKPYGWPRGIGISMRAKGPVDGSVVAGVALGFGCPAFILPKVASAMTASGRYDCRVTVSRHALDNLRVCLEQIDVELILMDEEGGYRPRTVLDDR